MDKKIRNRYYRRLLLDEVSNKQKRLKLSNRQLKNETNLLNDTTTWMKGVCICCSINLAIIYTTTHYSVGKYLAELLNSLTHSV